METFPVRTDVDLSDVPMVLAEEEMCRKLADEWYAEGVSLASDVSFKVMNQFGTGPRSDCIASFVWRRIGYKAEDEADGR